MRHERTNERLLENVRHTETLRSEAALHEFVCSYAQQEFVFANWFSS